MLEVVQTFENCPRVRVRVPCAQLEAEQRASRCRRDDVRPKHLKRTRARRVGTDAAHERVRASGIGTNFETVLGRDCWRRIARNRCCLVRGVVVLAPPVHVDAEAVEPRARALQAGRRERDSAAVVADGRRRIGTERSEVVADDVHRRDGTRVVAVATVHPQLHRVGRGLPRPVQVVGVACVSDEVATDEQALHPRTSRVCLLDRVQRTTVDVGERQDSGASAVARATHQPELVVHHHELSERRTDLGLFEIAEEVC